MPGARRQVVAALLIVTVLLNTLSLKAVFADGSHYFGSEYLNPFSHGFASLINPRLVAWGLTTLPVHLASVVGLPVLASILLYGAWEFGLFALTVWVLTRRDEPLGYLIAALMTFPMVVSSHFIVSESHVMLYGISLLTYAVVAERDPRREAVAIVGAILLSASYEAALLFLIVPVVAVWMARLRSRLVITGLIAVGAAFEVWAMSVRGVNHNVVSAVQVLSIPTFWILLLGMAVGLLGIFLLALRRPRLVVAMLALAAVATALMPLELSTRLATAIFKISYGFRTVTVGAAVAIAVVPFIMKFKLPTHRLWVNRRVSSTLALVTLSVFVLVTGFTSWQGVRWWFGFHTNVQSAYEGARPAEIKLAECEFCQHPNKYGYADLGWSWTYPMYSLLLANIFGDDGLVYVWTDEMIGDGIGFSQQELIEAFDELRE